MKKYEEGKDFEWKKMEGSNALTRHFFTAGEKAARAAPKPVSKPAVSKASGSTGPKPKQYSGRGDGIIEMSYRAIDDVTIPVHKTARPTNSPGKDGNKQLLRSEDRVASGPALNVDRTKAYAERDRKSNRRFANHVMDVLEATKEKKKKPGNVGISRYDRKK